MGSSSVSCALTGVTLSNQPAVLIPLAPARWPGEGGDRSRPSAIGGARVISNEGAGALFGPLALPILGCVGDYGDLESYEEDDNVRFLKVRFGDQFDDFIEGCTRGGHTKLTDRIARKIARSRSLKEYPAWDGTLSGCWVARDAWDLFSTKAWNENGTQRATVGDDGWLDPQNLKTMGFVSGPKDEETAKALFGNGPHEGDRYNTPYTHTELPEFIVWCDEHMSSRASYKGKKAEIGLTFQPFLKGLKKLGLKLPESARTAVTSTSIFRGHLIEARDKHVEDVERENRHEAFLKEYPQARFNQITVEGGDPNTEVYCSRDRYSPTRGKHFHVTLTGKVASETDGSESALRGEVESFTVTRCEGGDHKEVWKRGMQFTPAVWDALKEAGYKPRKRERLSMSSSDPYLRGFPEEALMLYTYRRQTMLSDRFLPAMEALLCFESNMYAANKMLAPTVSGWQCGNNATQREVARMALKLVAARENRYKR